MCPRDTELRPVPGETGRGGGEAPRTGEVGGCGWRGSRRGDAGPRGNSRWRARGCIWDLVGVVVGFTPGETIDWQVQKRLGPGDEITRKGSRPHW